MSKTDRSAPPASNATITIDADIAPRAARLAAAAAQRGANDVAIEQVLMKRRPSGERLTDEQLIEEMMNVTAQLFSRETVPPPLPTSPGTPLARDKAREPKASS